MSSRQLPRPRLGGICTVLYWLFFIMYTLASTPTPHLAAARQARLQTIGLGIPETMQLINHSLVGRVVQYTYMCIPLALHPYWLITGGGEGFEVR